MGNGVLSGSDGWRKTGKIVEDDPFLEMSIPWKEVSNGGRSSSCGDIDLANDEGLFSNGPRERTSESRRRRLQNLLDNFALRHGAPLLPMRTDGALAPSAVAGLGQADPVVVPLARPPAHPVGHVSRPAVSSVD